MLLLLQHLLIIADLQYCVCSIICCSACCLNHCQGSGCLCSWNGSVHRSTQCCYCSSICCNACCLDKVQELEQFSSLTSIVNLQCGNCSNIWCLQCYYGSKICCSACCLNHCQGSSFLCSWKAPTVSAAGTIRIKSIATNIQLNES